MLQVDVAGLQSAVAGLVAAANSLARLGAQSPVHPPLATDETSTSVAARLSEHAAVMASRAADGSTVLAAGAKAITQSAVAYGQMDQANQAVVSLQGNPAPSTPGFTPAVTVNLVAPDVPIAPPGPRPAETTAAIMEAGQPAAGDAFVADCAALSEGFSAAARSARRGAATVSEHLKGEAGPRISAALNRYADWAQEMARHADTVGKLAGSHKNRFTQAKQATPTTTEFANRHRELHNAIALNSSYPSPGSAAAVSKAHTEFDPVNEPHPGCGRWLPHRRDDTGGSAGATASPSNRGTWCRTRGHPAVSNSAGSGSKTDTRSPGHHPRRRRRPRHRPRRPRRESQCRRW